MTHRTRRSFIRTTALTGAGIFSAPLLIPANVWGAETKPNSRLAIGFIGMGRHSRGLLGAFLHQDNTRVVAVCDVDTTRRENAKRTVDEHYAETSTSSGSGCAAYNDFRELIARKDIDVVCIATPDHWHAIITLAALRSGKDVYCEKPLTQTIHEAVVVMKAVKETGRVLQTGSMQRSSSEFRVACELVRNGAIGKVRSVVCSFGPPPVPCDLPEETLEPGLDWDLWLGPAPLRSYHSDLSPRGMHNHYPAWRNYSEYGGGKVTDWGAHHLDIAQWGLGMDDSGPVHVVPPENPDDRSGAKLVYANGVSVTHMNGFGVDFIGSEGRVRVNRGKLIVEREGREIARCEGLPNEETSIGREVQKAQRELLQDAKIKLYVSRNHVVDFLACVRSRQQPIAHAEIGGRSVICCHLMNLAYRHGRKLDWNPDQLTFADGNGDSTWLTRDYRAPWKV